MNQNSAAILEIESRITGSQDALTTLETEIAALEEKKKEKEADLPRLKSDLEALNRTLAILKGTVQHEEIKASPSPSPTLSNIVPGSHTDLAREVLLGHGTFLRMTELLIKANEKKPGLNIRSFGTNVYRLASEGKIFVVDKKRGIGLLEW